MTRMIGYYQRVLVGHNELLVEHQLQQCVLNSEGSLDGIYVESQPRPPELLSLLRELDRRHDSRLVETVTTLCQRDGIDLGQFRGSPDASQFWTAVHDLETTGGHLVVPHLGHLDNLGKSRRELMEHIDRARPALGLIDASSPPHTVRAHRSLGAVIGEFSVAPVSPATEIAGVNTRRILGLAGLTHMVPVIGRVMYQLVDALLEPSHVLCQDHRLTIQLARTPSGVVVACWDTRDYIDQPPPRAVTDACIGGRVVRTRWGTGTETRCEIPFPENESVAARSHANPRATPVQVR